jgi:prepilin signal peptidase PulO-like enzyme (type II secretory pathway)
MDYIILAILGLTFGSFITALTWRIHEGKDFVAGRSECESCGHVLGALDLVPIFSWLSLGGRCRYCRKRIGWQNPVIEAVTALLFVGSYIFWPTALASWQAWASFGLWLVYVVMLVALVVYDIRWMLLPDKLVYTLIALGLFDAGLRLWLGGGLSVITYAVWVVLGAGALGGFYGLLYGVSKGKWVGFGDVKLGIFIGVVLGWQLALLALFLANALGLLVVAPALLSGKVSVKSRVPFGPFLIAAFIIAGLFGPHIIDWYSSLILLR